MKLSDWARQQGIAYITAWRWFKCGKLPVPAKRTPSGCILVEPVVLRDPKASRTWIYGRVSSHNKREDLKRQVERCQTFCLANGWPVDHVVQEIASGMNDARPRLQKLLAAVPDRLVVEHKDRLTRFGFRYLETLLPQLGCELVVINRDVEEQADLMKDLVAVVTSFCCRLYGLRRGHAKAQQIKASL